MVRGISAGLADYGSCICACRSTRLSLTVFVGKTEGQGVGGAGFVISGMDAFGGVFGREGMLAFASGARDGTRGLLMDGGGCRVLQAGQGMRALNLPLAGKEASH